MLQGLAMHLPPSKFTSGPDKSDCCAYTASTAMLNHAEQELITMEVQ